MSHIINHQEEEIAPQVEVEDSITDTSPESISKQNKFRMLNTIRQYLPTVLIFGLFGGIAYLGHHWQWKIPKFSEITGNNGVPEEAWCNEHGVPEAICISCNSELMPKGKLYGWCDKHGVSECVFEHPELAQLPKTPEILQADLDRAQRALKIKPRKQNKKSCKLHLRRIQFVSTKAVEKAGIDIRITERRDIDESIRANGEVRYNPTMVSRLSSRSEGTVWSVEKNVGDPVKEGDILALVDAAEVGQAKSALLEAIAQLNLQKKVHERLSKLKDVVAGKRLQESEAALIKSEVAVKKIIQALSNLGLLITFEETQGITDKALTEKLRFLGIPKHIVSKLSLEQATANLIPIVAPRNGVVVQRDVTSGEVIESSKLLFTVVDTSRMWLIVNVSLENADLVKLGQKVLFQPDGSSRSYQAKTIWISTEVDHVTRTLEIRAELSNREGTLRNESFGTGEIILRQEKNAIVVPEEAIHWEGCCHIVFVRDKDYLKKDSYKVFHTRMVRLGATEKGITEVIAGLLPGEVIVTEGGGVLRAELLKGNLGAG